MKSKSETELLLSKVDDAVTLYQRRGCPVYSGFYNENEISAVIGHFASLHFTDFVFWGGAQNCTRMMMSAGFSSNYDFPITVLRFDFRKCDELSHRDFLGAFMSLGLSRETIGDIIVDVGVSYAFVKNEIADFIMSQISKIGRVGVKITKEENVSLSFEQKTQEIVLSVSSLRVDNIVSKICFISRSEAAKLISSELVFVNHVAVKSNSLILKENDVITIRKKGKFIFQSILGLSKKGKQRILLKHFR